jgi:hypothetical protein
VNREERELVDQEEITRLRIANDMRENPEVKAKVENLLGVEKAKIRFPEAYK